MSLLPAVANRLYMAGARASWRRFDAATRDPAAAQHAVLARILRANADTGFGRRHAFASIANAAAYRARVPVADHDALESDIGRIARGASRVFTAEPVICVELTGGSSGANKLVPYTRGLLREFSAATLPWTFDLLRARPALRNGRAYWAVTPPARAASRTEGGIPIGLDHDSDYFPAFARALLDRVVGTPRLLSRAPDVHAWRYLTLRALLAIEDLSFISVWSPSFLTLLAESLRRDFAALVCDMEQGTLAVQMDATLRREFERALPARPRLARDLRRRFGRTPPDDLGLVWPRLALISCWTDAHAARALGAMRAHFPRVEVQGKGLLATEGVVSFPLFDASAPVAAVTSHYLEFLPPGDARSVGIEELETGGTYEVLLTTSGGLYRYRLRDLVRVEGWYRRTPMLSFQGRADHTSDLAGEKLTPAFAEQVLRRALASTSGAMFAMLAPRAANGRAAGYDLLVDCAPGHAERLAAAVEEELAQSHHYALCRRLGQLAPVQPVIVPDAQRAYERHCIARGQRISAIKPAALGVNFVEDR